MSYLGSSAAPLPVAFAGQQGQSFNGGTNTFTLSRAVARTLDIDLIVNNVLQNPYDGSYSVSGNVVTTAETVSAGVGNVYVIFRDAPIGSFGPIDGSVTPAKMSVGAPTWSQSNGVSLPRIDSSAEGGQLNLNRSSDDTNAWAFDVYGSGSNPALRVLDIVNGAEIQRWNQSGSIVLKGGSSSANGTGIAFPSTQSASSDANTLDDYEEGTFTPSIQGNTTAGTASYTAQQASYTKIGRQVTVSVYMAGTFSVAPTGTVRINGLPFTTGAGGINNFSAVKSALGWMDGNAYVYAPPDGTSYLLCGLATAKTSALTSCDFSTSASQTNFQMHFVLTYFV
jgi:hypothetical protein